MKKTEPTHNRISKLYIANRGEIALRIQRTAKRLKIPCVVGISEADEKLSFATMSQETVCIGPAPAHLSYLSIDAVISAALKSGSNAVHPGYGFLSENSEFAQRVIDAGLIWVGPSPESIRLMGSKVEGRRHAKRARVKTVPGTEGGLSDGELTKAAKQIGFPLIIKAVGGGGGRGMRVIRSIQELKELLPRARSEAKKNFGNEDIFLERFIEKPRHVEVQLLGDMHGTLIHLGTRDCSAQRRHQKLIEEAPAPFLSPTMRSAIQKAAVAVARSVGYYSAGTAEFLVDGKDFYFLEMNTRIQVEHPVTEVITGTDLIEQQLLVAQGKKLSLTQKRVAFSGHAMEFRINAEDARTNFTPTTGLIERLALPTENANVRNDFGFQAGDEVSVFYDGLIGKLIVSGKTRRQALQRAVAALTELDVDGLTTNLEFHRWIVRTRIFNQDGVDIAFVGREFDPSCLDDLLIANREDPEVRQFLSRNNSIEKIETLYVKKGRATVEVHIACQPNGTFIAMRGKKKVASNSKQTAISEILA